MVYRSKLEIRADILSVAKDGSKPTNIMYEADLNHKMLIRYLQDLLEGGMLHFDKKTGIYYTTYRGSKHRKEILKTEKTYKKLLQRKKELKKEKVAILIDFGLQVK